MKFITLFRKELERLLVCYFIASLGEKGKI